MPAAKRRKNSSGRALQGASLQLFLLGPFRLTGPRGEVDLGSKKLCALLAFLACAGHEPQAREKLTALLWGSHFEAQARQNMRKALSRIRQTIGTNLLAGGDDKVSISAGALMCDVKRFEALVRDGSHAALKEAVDLYKGTFLADLSIKEEGWVEWVTAQRVRLESLEVNALVRLSEAELQGSNAELALEYATRAVSIDPLREDAHRLIIRSLASAGRKAEALRKYDQLAVLLKEELKIDPDASTKALAAELRSPAPQWRERSDAAATISLSGQLSPPSELPSIAVLPFRSLGADRLSDYFGDGIVEDIVVSLGSLHELFVISRGSTLAFRGKEPDPRDVGRALGVRYVVGGSVRRSGKRLRIFVELCDAETGTALWTDRTEAPLGDLFDIQDSYTSSFAGRIAPHIRGAELKRAMRKRPETMTAYDFVLQALDHVHRDATFERAGGLLQKAIEKEPTFALPYAWASWWRAISIRQGWSRDPAADWLAADRLAAKAIDLDPQNALALASYGHLKSMLHHDFDSAELFLESAVQACPNGPVAWVLGSFMQSYAGRGEEALRRAGQALRLSPLDRGRFYCHLALSVGHYVGGQFDEAVTWAQRSVTENPGFTASLRYLAASLAASGRMDEARKVAKDMLAREPKFRLGTYATPFRDKAISSLLIERLRLAGLPD